MIKKILTSLIIISLSVPLVGNEGKVMNDINKKVDSVLSKMTLEEKIGQMNQYNFSLEVTGPGAEKEKEQKIKAIKDGKVGSLLNVTSAAETRKVQKFAVEESRLGIPLIFGYDVIHGYKTTFPVPIAGTSSWNMDAIEKASQIAAKEAAAGGVHWTFAPMVDISRDSRWGRIMEGPGEDPYLGSKMARAKVRGFQGNDLSKNNTIAACAKHYAAYGAPMGGKDYNTVELSDYTLFNNYLPPFKASIEAGAATIMNAFNTVNGRPATGHNYLVNDILKDTWNFSGYVVSDWNSVGELIQHGVAKNSKEAARIAANGGTDMEMHSGTYVDHLAQLVKAGKVKEATIDEAVKRILRIKFKLGLFEDPYKYSSEQREEKVLEKDSHVKASRKLAEESVVLLKNEKELLPLPKDIDTIAVVGPLANDKDSPLGSWRAKGGRHEAVSVLEGIKDKIGSEVEILHAEGCILDKNEADEFHEEVDINKEDTTGIAEAVEVAEKADYVIAAVGETAFMSGEARSRRNVELPGVQKQLLKEINKTGKPIVTVLLNGRPLALKWTANNIPAVLETWFLGQESGHVIADILFGEVNPSGKLPASFPETNGQVPVYYNKLNTGRPNIDTSGIFISRYIDGSDKPLFPFGYGLSYTEFEYSDLELDKNKITKNQKLDVSVKVKNTGDRKGKEIVQLYIRDLVGTYSRPIKELKGFKKVTLKPGETRKVDFELDQNDLSYYDKNYELLTEPGEFKVMVGKNSVQLLAEKFELVE